MLTKHTCLLACFLSQINGFESELFKADAEQLRTPFIAGCCPAGLDIEYTVLRKQLKLRLLVGVQLRDKQDVTYLKCMSHQQHCCHNALGKANMLCKISMLHAE